MEKRTYIKKWILIAGVISMLLLLLAMIGYKRVEGMIIEREEANLKSLANVSAQSLISTLEAKQRLVYATFSGDVENREEVELKLLKLMEKGEYISLEGKEQEEWQKQLKEKALLHPGEVISGPVLMTEEGNYALYMAKAISMKGSLCGYILIEINLDEVYEEEQALSGLEIEEGRYCLVKSSAGETVMPMKNVQRDISLEERAGENCTIEWVYETADGIPKRIKKLIASKEIIIGEEHFYLYMVDNYKKIIQPIERVALYFFLFCICLLFTSGVFIYQLVSQHEKETELVRKLQHERTLNEVMKKQEGLMQKYNHSKTMTVLTGVLAHEFNNLMTPIVLYAELLEDNEVVVHEMPEEISELKSAAVRCGELAKQLLDYSRQGRAEKILVNYDATYAVHEAVNIVKKLIPEKVELKENICKMPYYIHGQAGAMNQIVLNLSTNAIYAMKEGGTLTICFGKNAENEKEVRLVIEDTGSGIPKQVRQKVFQPFFTTKPTGEGTGIGLTVVRRLTEEHGGRIHVKSEEGKGTIFILDFPIMELGNENY